MVVPSAVGAGSASAGLSLPGLTSTLSSLSALQTTMAPLAAGLGPILGPLGLSKPAAPAAVATPTPAPALAPAGAQPLAPTSVTAVQDAPSPDITVNWVNATTGTPATGAVVVLNKVTGTTSSAVTSITCGNCTTSTLRSLSFGTSYQAVVTPTTSAGSGTPAKSPIVTPTTTCTVGACVALDATAPIGAANHAASGLVQSLNPMGNDGADVVALDTSMYRGAPKPEANNTFDWSSYNLATAAGAKTTVGLDGLWKVDNNNSAPTPWSNWSAYSSWVTATVKALEASGKEIDYWSVYNEPGGNDSFYNAAGYASETPALLLQQFLVAYLAIKAADPNANVIGPDLEEWSDYPSQYAVNGHSFDMVTFLNYAVANNIKLAAIAWHEIDNTSSAIPEENTLLPAMVEDHVADARALIAARPSLGHPQIFINEYGMPDVQKIPGWDVAYLSALTDAGVNFANRACWNGDCLDPDLDGLISTTGTTPQADFYDRLVYASMSGSMIAATSTSDTVTALGSFNSTTGTLVGLVGRGVGCSQNTGLCPSSWPDYKRATQTEVIVTMTVPWTSGSAKVILTHISGALPILGSSAPSSSVQTVTIVPTGNGKGTITVPIGSFADGDAYGMTVTH
ncbi:MAG TPA: hypothetical protein VG298_17265 [Acidimicrobiales bacterium]|nr:hypothetical protein [Acidimicrobiales bacterium]